MAGNDAGFRQFGRPKTVTDKRVDTERLNCVLDAEHELFLLKSMIWGDSSHTAQNIQLQRVFKALRPLRVEVIKNGASEGHAGEVEVQDGTTAGQVG